MNVPSAVWIDEEGFVRRIDEGTYAQTHKMGEMEFGRDDYAPMVADWVRKGDKSLYVPKRGTMSIAAVTPDAAKAEPAFALGVYFHQSGNRAKAEQYWQQAQILNPASWNYHRQDWSFTPEEASQNWLKKYEALDGRHYYRPIEGLDNP